MTEWWNGLQPRERRTLLIGGIALGIIFFYFLIWLPTHRAADQLQQNVVDQRLLLSWMQQISAEAQTLRGSMPEQTATGDDRQALFALADQSARQAGLGSSIRRVEPSGDNRVRVNLDDASFDDILGWLATLKTRHGIEATTVTIRSGQAPGRVNAQLLLEAPGT